MKSWVEAIGDLHRDNAAFVLITLLAVRGSTPRDTDSKMVVTADQQFDSIGGGKLEYHATGKARELLARGTHEKIMEEFSLGATLGQCCGGRASLLLECFPARQCHLVLFGGGHVASALVTILAQLPLRLHWLDSREQLVAEHASDALQYHDSPADIVATVPAQAACLVMTHDHALDFTICTALIERQQERSDLALIGLIGSQSKAAKFRKRLAHRGCPTPAIDTLRCPIGLASVPGKRPMEIAVAIAAELIAWYSAGDAAVAAGSAITCRAGPTGSPIERSEAEDTPDTTIACNRRDQQ